MKYLKIGAGFLVGGGILFLTGGLVAPAIGFYIIFIMMKYP